MRDLDSCKPLLTLLRAPGLIYFLYFKHSRHQNICRLGWLVKSCQMLVNALKPGKPTLKIRDIDGSSQWFDLAH